MTTPEESSKLNKDAAEALPDPNDFNLCIEFFDKHPELMTPPHLNNFHMNMPGSSRRGDHKSAKERRMTLKETETTSEFGDPRSLPLFSERRASQTDDQFYAEIDEVLAHLGINFSETPPAGDPRLVPVYLELKRRGYRYYDLVR